MYTCLISGGDQSTKEKVQVIKINAIFISANTCTQKCNGQITERHSLSSEPIRKYAATGNKMDKMETRMKINGNENGQKNKQSTIYAIKCHCWVNTNFVNIKMKNKTLPLIQTEFTETITELNR